MTEVTLHLELRPAGTSMKLTHRLGNGVTEELDVPADAIGHHIERAETDYYAFAPADAVGLGRSLYDFLDGDRRLLTRTIQDQLGKADLLVVAVSVTGPLVHLPWELLHDGNEYLVDRRRAPRVIPVRWRPAGGTAPAPTSGPLRVAFMAAEPEHAQSPLDYHLEEARIWEATRGLPISLEVEDSGDLAELGKLLSLDEPVDVVHLTGHAHHAPHGPEFVFEDEVGGPRNADAQAIDDALDPRPQLLFLSGCRTAEGGIDSGVPSMAQSLIEMGHRAVLGWGRPVLDDYATIAAAAMYESLAKARSPAQTLWHTYRALRQSGARDWHLLRLFVLGEMPGPLVATQRRRGPDVHVRRRLPGNHLDVEGAIAIPDRRQFVGRRREVQRWLRLVRDPETEKVGMVLRGPGGIGKTTLAARLAERMPHHETVVLHSRKTLRFSRDTLISGLSHHRATRIAAGQSDPALPLVDRLAGILAGVPDDLLLLLDNFESNYAEDESSPKAIDMRDGVPQLAIGAQEALEAVVAAVGESARDHWILLTTRYVPPPSIDRQLKTIKLRSLAPLEVERLFARLLDRLPVGREVSPARLDWIRRAAEGNPRLITWLMEVVANDDLDETLISTRLLEREATFREDLLAEILLEAQDAELRTILAAAGTFRVPVAPASIAQVAGSTQRDVERACERAAGVGLLEVVELDRGTSLYRLPAVLLSIVEVTAAEDPATRAHKAAHALSQELGTSWHDVPDARAIDQTRLAELHRLALAGDARELAVDAAVRLAEVAACEGLHELAYDVCAKTSARWETPRLLGIMATNQAELGDMRWATRLFDRALEGAGPQQPERAAILAAKAFHQFGRSETEAATLLEEAIELARSSEDIPTLIFALTNQAHLLALSGDEAQVDRAEAAFAEAEELARSRPDNGILLATVWHEKAFALLHAARNDVEGAVAMTAEALAVFEKADLVVHQAAALHNMADMLADGPQAARAEQLAKRSLERTRAIGLRRGQMASLRVLGDVYGKTGRPEQAMEKYDEAILMAEGNQALREQTIAMSRKAGLLADGTDDEQRQAARLYEETLPLLTTLGQQGAIVRIRLQLAELATTRGDPAAAREQLALAIEQPPTSELDLHAYVHERIAELEPGRAETHLLEALELHERADDAEGAVRSAVALGQLALSRDDTAAAIAYFERALALGARVEDPHLEADVRQRLAMAAMAGRQLEAAVGYLEPVVELSRDAGDRRTEASTILQLAQLRRSLGQKRDVLDDLAHVAQLIAGDGDLALRAAVQDALTAAHRDAGDESAARAAEREGAALRLRADPITVMVGEGLLDVFDPERGGRALAEIQRMREEVEAEHGWSLPKVRIMDAMSLGSSTVQILIHGDDATQFELPGRHAVVSGEIPVDVLATTHEIGYEHPVSWVTAEQAASIPSGVVDAAEVFGSNLRAVLLQRRHEIT